MSYSPYDYPHFEPKVPSRTVNFGWLAESFDLFKQQPVFWVVASALFVIGPYIVDMPFSIGSQLFMQGSPSWMPVTVKYTPAGMYAQMAPTLLINWMIRDLFSCYVLSGMMRTAIRQVRAELIDLGDLFRGGPKMLRVFGFSVIPAILQCTISAPALLFVFPNALHSPSLGTLILLISAWVALSLILGALIGLLMPALALIADGEKVFRAISRSFGALKYDWIRACLLFFLCAIIGLLSMIPCGVGLAVTIPMGVLILALLYRDMMGMPAPVVLNQFEVSEPAQEGVWPPPPAQPS